jgi:hypothetical protein
MTKPLLATDVLTPTVLMNARQTILNYRKVESPNGDDCATELALSVLRAADRMWQAEENDSRDSRCWHCCSGWGHDIPEHQNSVNQFERSR